jgi:DnaK suppressor protein
VGAPALTSHDIRQFRVKLITLLDRLSGATAHQKLEVMLPTGSNGTAADAPEHEPTATSTEGDEEVAYSALLTEEQLLVEVREALARLETGTFGRCERCGRAITRVRLDAVPYARHCIHCARAANCEPA